MSAAAEQIEAKPTKCPRCNGLGIVAVPRETKIMAAGRVVATTRGHEIGICECRREKR